ncbi:hypothetical protein U1839_25255 [Sphingomonas sp. RT2P30]|uniref:hypothetical protein n=1 Tax=Parasphingomonas halimpatiens TaxID=3096162 RepID=UPI002FC6B1D7
MTHWVWAMLGIAPTDDVRAIRSAYAAMLKSFDPDADLERFARLREARELAVRLARSATAPPPEVAADAEGPADDAFAPASAYPADPPPAALSSPSPEDRIDAHYATLVAMLSAPGDGRPPDADTAARMLEHFEAILADPRMQQLTFRAAAEDRWLHVLSTTTPHSDPLLPRAIEEFGWRNRGGQLSQPQVIDALVHYADDSRRRHHVLDSVAQFRADLQNPAHEHHRAWRDLTGTGDTDTPRGLLTVPRVNALIEALREYFPPLLNELNEGRVRYWQVQAQRREQRKQWIIGPIAVLVVAAFFGLVMLAPPDPQQPPRRPGVVDFLPDSVSLRNVDLDLAPALKQVLPDTSAADVARWNPTLYAALKQRWNDARRDDTTPGYFTTMTVEWLHAVFAANLDRAPRDDLEEYRQIEAHRLKALDERGGTACADYMDGKTPPPALDHDYQERMTTLEGRVILDMPYRGLPAAPPARSFIIPGAVMAQIGKRTGLPRARLSDALDRHGPAHAQCAARIALIDAVLHLQTSAGLTLLRDM